MKNSFNFFKEAKTTNENRCSPSTKGINLSFDMILPSSSKSLKSDSTPIISPVFISTCFWNAMLILSFSKQSIVSFKASRAASEFAKASIKKKEESFSNGIS